MGHHKRKKPKQQRAGCLFCKPHKANCSKGKEENRTMQEKKARLKEKEDE